MKSTPILTEHDWPAIEAGLVAYRDYLREHEPQAVNSIQALELIRHDLPPEKIDDEYI